MKIPTVTAEKPYIEFRIDKNGKLTLSATSDWWGGKKAGFISSDGSEGNTCEPAKLQEYIESYYTRKIKDAEKQIASHQKKIKKMLLEVPNVKLEK